MPSNYPFCDVQGCSQPLKGHGNSAPTFPRGHWWLEEHQTPKSLPRAEFTCLEMGRAVLSFELGLQSWVKAHRQHRVLEVLSPQAMRGTVSAAVPWCLLLPAGKRGPSLPPAEPGPLSGVVGRSRGKQPGQGSSSLLPHPQRCQQVPALRLCWLQVPPQPSMCWELCALCRAGEGQEVPWTLP